MDKKKIGLLIKLLREDNEETLEEFAEKCGIGGGKSYLSRIESGTRTPGTEVLQKIASRFEMTVQDLWMHLLSFESRCIFKVDKNRISSFLGREEKMDELKGHLELPGQQILISGLHGIGKSALAREFCYEMALEKCHIIWLSCRSLSYHEALFNLAWEPFYSGRKSSNREKQSAFVNQWLASFPERCVLVFDNVETEEFFQEARFTPNITSIFTSRYAFSNFEGVELKVERWSFDVGVRFLKERLGGRSSDFVELSKLCGGIPIIYNQVCVLLRKCPDVSAEKLVENFHEKGDYAHRVMELFKHSVIETLDALGSIFEKPLVEACVFVVFNAHKSGVKFEVAVEFVQVLISDVDGDHVRGIFREIISWNILEYDKRTRSIIVSDQHRKVVEARYSIGESEEWNSIVKFCLKSLPYCRKLKETDAEDSASWPRYQVYVKHIMGYLLNRSLGGASKSEIVAVQGVALYLSAMGQHQASVKILENLLQSEGAAWEMNLREEVKRDIAHRYIYLDRLKNAEGLTREIIGALEGGECLDRELLANSYITLANILDRVGGYEEALEFSQKGALAYYDLCLDLESEKRFWIAWHNFTKIQLKQIRTDGETEMKRLSKMALLGLEGTISVRGGYCHNDIPHRIELIRSIAKKRKKRRVEKICELCKSYIMKKIESMADGEEQVEATDEAQDHIKFGFRFVESIKKGSPGGSGDPVGFIASAERIVLAELRR